MKSAESVVIGGGIVGLATAWQILQKNPGLSLVLLEKESRVAAHQTGRNSGVLHSGIYYKPGSLRARNCRLGKEALQNFCDDHGIEYNLCGKVIVAVTKEEFPALERIYERGQANGVTCELIDQTRLNEIEPHTAGLRAIHVPESGIIGYRSVCEKLAELIVNAGGEVLFDNRVLDISREGSSAIVQTSQTELESRCVVNCCGLHSDRVAQLAGTQVDARIVPFRGEYFELHSEAEHLCRSLIYPVPDPQFPFLGVHFTRMIEGGVECGPNAVLAFAREGYTKLDINLRDLLESLSYPGFQRLALRHWKTGLGEMWRSFSKQAFVKALQRLVPDIRAEHLTAIPAGVRAQALRRDGNLVDDFLIVDDGPIVNVCNAPSPAATAALNIGHLVAEQAQARLT